MATKMKEKYDKYWSNSSNINMFLFIAPILDPRYKFMFPSLLTKVFMKKSQKFV